MKTKSQRDHEINAAIEQFKREGGKVKKIEAHDDDKRKISARLTNAHPNIVKNPRIQESKMISKI